MNPLLSRPLGYCSSQVDAPNKGLGERNLLSLSYGNIIRKDITGSDGLLPESFETYNVVESGDTVLRLTDLQNDQRSLRVGFVRERGIITSAYLTLRPHDDVDQRFFSYILKSMDFCKDFYALGAGVRQSLKFDELKRVSIYLPNLGSQRAIANHLDTETNRVDALIEKKQQILNFLEELEISIIDRMFDGKSWPKNRLKYVVKINPESLSESTDLEFEIRYLDIGSVGRGRLVTDPDEMSFGDAPSRARRLVRGGDVIVSTVRTYLRAVWTVPESYAGVVVSTGFAVLRPNELVDPAFLSLYCRSSTFIEQVVARSVGVSYPGINARDVISLPIPLPDIIDQQKAVAGVVKRLDNTAKARTLLKGQIELLRERRQALITAMVTGEFEIPEVAA